jgi:hypothetical protein
MNYFNNISDNISDNCDISDNFDISDNCDISDNINDENYIIKTQMNKSLCKKFGILNDENYENINYDIPNKHGLDNCNIIIPYNYFKLIKFDEINYLTIIKDDIRNFKKLNNYQLEYIYKLDNKEKNNIISLFNDCISLVNENNIM